MSDKDYPAAVRAYCQAIPECMNARMAEWHGPPVTRAGRNAEGSGIDAYNEPAPHAGVDPYVILHPIPAFDGWQRSAGRAFHVEVA